MPHSSLHNAFTTTLVIWLKTFGYAVSAFSFDYLHIPQEQLTILGVLMVIDTITGISKVYRVEPRNITSHALSVGVMKKIGLVLVIYTLALIGK